MFYENMPLYPGMKGACRPEGCMKVRLFDDGCGRDCRPPAMRECERVTVENPCRPGERAEVVLGVDDCGNLVICVHRDLCEPCRPCRPHDPCHDPCRLHDTCRPHDPCHDPCRPPRGRCRIPCRRPPLCREGWD